MVGWINMYMVDRQMTGWMNIWIDTVALKIEFPYVNVACTYYCILPIPQYAYVTQIYAYVTHKFTHTLHTNLHSFAAFLRHTKDYFCIYMYGYLRRSSIQQSKLEN